MKARLSVLLLCPDVHLRLDVRRILAAHRVGVTAQRSIRQLEKTLRLHVPDAVVVEQGTLTRTALRGLIAAASPKCPLLLIEPRTADGEAAEPGVPEGVDAVLATLGLA